MSIPRKLGRDILERDVNRLKSFTSDLGGFTITDPLVTRNIQPEIDCTYDLGTVDKQFQRLWLCQSLAFGEPDDYDDPATYLWYTKGAGYTQLFLRVQEDTSGYGQLYLRCNGTAGDYSYVRLESEGGGNTAEFSVKVGAGRAAGVAQYEFYETSASIQANVKITGGLFLTTPGLSAYVDEAALAFYWRDSDPNKPAINGEAAIWLSDGTGSGAAGDLMCEIRASNSTRTFTLASHGGGSGSVVTDQYLSHNGDLDTRINFTDDKIAFEAGGVTFLELTEAAQDIIHFNSADADIDFQVDTTLGDGSLFVEGSTGRVGLNITSSLTGLLHANQSVADGAIPVVHLEQDDVSEEFVRFTGTAAAATLTNSLVAEADVTTATRIGFVKINIQDKGNQIADGPAFVAAYTLA